MKKDRKIIIFGALILLLIVFSVAMTIHRKSIVSSKSEKTDSEGGVSQEAPFIDEEEANYKVEDKAAAQKSLTDMDDWINSAGSLSE